MSEHEIEVHHHLLAENDRHAGGIRELLRTHGVFCVNVMSSPGAGKTALLEATLGRLADEYRIAVIEGDIETTADADRLSPSMCPWCRSTPGRSGASAIWLLRSWRRRSNTSTCTTSTY